MAEASPVIRVKLPYEDAREFLDRHAARVASKGVQIPTGKLRPVGSLVRLVLELRNGELVSGEAMVESHVRIRDASGLSLRYLRLDPGGVAFPLRASAPTPAPRGATPAPGTVRAASGTPTPAGGRTSSPALTPPRATPRPAAARTPPPSSATATPSPLLSAPTPPATTRPRAAAPPTLTPPVRTPPPGAGTPAPQRRRLTLDDLNVETDDPGSPPIERAGAPPASLPETELRAAPGDSAPPRLTPAPVAQLWRPGDDAPPDLTPAPVSLLWRPGRGALAAAIVLLVALGLAGGGARLLLARAAPPSAAGAARVATALATADRRIAEGVLADGPDAALDLLLSARGPGPRTRAYGGGYSSSPTRSSCWGGSPSSAGTRTRRRCTSPRPTVRIRAARTSGPRSSA